MPFRAHRSMTLSGKDFARGSIVQDEDLADVPEGRIGALIRTGLLQPLGLDPRLPASLQREAKVEPEGQMCPICGEGPFTRLAMHTQAKHEPVDLGEEE